MPTLTRQLAFDPATGALLVERSSACGRCKQAGHCASSVLTRTQPIALAVPAEAGARSRYVARFPAGALLALCAVVFPLLAVVVLSGAALAQLWFPGGGDAAAAAGACAGLLVGLAGLKLYDSASGSRGILARLVIVPSDGVDTAGT